jgi:hypothetical protein
MLGVIGEYEPRSLEASSARDREAVLKREFFHE